MPLPWSSIYTFLLQTAPLTPCQLIYRLTAQWCHWGSLSSGLVGVVGVERVCVVVVVVVVWGVINEDWNVERKQTRPRRHLSFTKLARLTDFFFYSPPHPPLNHYHPSGLCHPLTHTDSSAHTHQTSASCTHTFFSPSPPLSFFSPSKCGAEGTWVHALLHLPSISVTPLLSIMYLSVSPPALEEW